MISEVCLEIVYALLLAGIAAIYVISLVHTKEKISDEYEFMNGLKWLDALSMTLTGICGRLFKSKKKSRYNDDRLRKIYVKDNVEEVAYVHRIRKVSLSIVIFSVFLILGILNELAGETDEKNISNIKRPDYGKGQKQMDVIAEFDDEKESLHLKVDEKRYTDKEVENIFSGSYKEVIRAMLGKNKSVDKVMYNLNLIDSYGSENIKIGWDLDDVKIVDYDGSVYRDNEDHEVKLYMTMSLEDYEKKYEVSLVIKAEKETDKSLQDKIQQYIDEEDLHNSNVSLPDKVDGVGIKYRLSGSGENIPFLIFGVVAAVLMYFLKDNDMDKELKKRKMQLEDDYSGIVSRVMLLTAAGMTIKNAWLRIADDYTKNERKKRKRYAYEEILLAAGKIRGGQSEKEVYRMFGKRCGIQMYIKFCNILEQNVIKGTKGMRELLEYEVHEAFENKKMLAKKRGDEAGTKMLLPMVIMLVIAIVIIVVPSFLTMERGM